MEQESKQQVVFNEIAMICTEQFTIDSKESENQSEEEVKHKRLTKTFVDEFISDLEEKQNKLKKEKEARVKEARAKAKTGSRIDLPEESPAEAADTVSPE